MLGVFFDCSNLDGGGILIILKEKGNTKSKLIFPSMPEEVTTSVDTNYQTYSLLNRGAVMIPKGVEPKKITWSGEFFGKAKKNEAVVIKNKWISPKECKNILEKWQRDRTVLILLITEIGMNIDVTISSFEKTAYGAYGNLKYSIALKKSEALRVYTNSDKKKKESSSGKKKTTERVTTKKKKSYTVKSGDNLWKIAKKVYGLGSDWQKIYKNNKEVIETAAKKHGKKNSDYGHWIYPGTKLTIT